MLYNIIYDFFINNVFKCDAETNGVGLLETTTFNVGSSTMALNVWLSHTCTIILLALAVVWLLLVVRWIFRVFSGLIRV